MQSVGASFPAPSVTALDHSGDVINQKYKVMVFFPFG
jgi:hypothetical protein